MIRKKNRPEVEKEMIKYIKRKRLKVYEELLDLEEANFLALVGKSKWKLRTYRKGCGDEAWVTDVKVGRFRETFFFDKKTGKNLYPDSV